MIPPYDTLQTWSANLFFHNVRPAPVRPKSEDYPTIELVRIFRWNLNAERPKDPPPTKLPFAWPDAIRPAGKAVKALGYFRGITPNRGAPFTSEDLFYLHPTHTFVNRKADGTEAIILFRNHVTYLAIRGDPAAYVVEGLRGPKGFVVQVELIGSDPAHPVEVVVADVLRTGGNDTGYESRMAQFHAVCGSWRLPVIIPEMQKLKTHPRMLDEMLPEAHYPTDGFVLNFAGAPAGQFAGGIGAARYLKFIYTVDVLVDGKIVEQTLSDPPLRVRDRPDKSEPNPPDLVWRLKHGWDPGQLVRIVRLLSCQPSSLRDLYGARPRESAPYYDLDIPLLAYLWCPWRDRTVETTIFIRNEPDGQLAVRKFGAAMKFGFRRLALPPPVGIPGTFQSAPAPRDDTSMPPEQLVGFLDEVFADAEPRDGEAP